MSEYNPLTIFFSIIDFCLTICNCRNIFSSLKLKLCYIKIIKNIFYPSVILLDNFTYKIIETTENTDFSGILYFI